MPRIEIVGDAEKAAKYTTWARGEWAKVDGTKYGYVDGFAIQYINHDGEGVIRFIELASHAFLCTPRTGTRWSSREVWPGVSGYAISDGRVFALNAKGEIYEGGEYEPFLVGGGAYSPAFQVKKEDEVVVKYPKAGKPNLYGNMLWVSDVGDKILSWQSKYSPGIPHIPTSEPFQAILYQDGDIFQPQPPGSVLGAGRYEKRLYVVCMDGADTIAAILNGREWLEIGRWSTGRLKTPFLLSGGVFTSPAGATVTVSEDSASYYPASASPVGTATESGSDADIRFVKSASGVFNGMVTRIESTTSSQTTGSSDSDEQTFDVVLSGPIAAHAVIEGPVDIAVGSMYSVTRIDGQYCSWSWSAPGTFHKISETTIIMDSVPGCGMGTVTAIADTGASASKEVRLPNGVWVTTGTDGTSRSFTCQYQFVTADDGFTRDLATVDVGCNNETGGGLSYMAAIPIRFSYHTQCILTGGGTSTLAGDQMTGEVSSFPAESLAGKYVLCCGVNCGLATFVVVTVQHQQWVCP